MTRLDADTISRLRAAVQLWPSPEPPPAPPSPNEQQRGEIECHSAAEVRAANYAETDWYIPGLIARGWTVQLAGREKQAGKGTFACYLISRLERAEPTIFGDSPSEPIKTLILTEEPMDSMQEKLNNFAITDAVIVWGWELAQHTWPEKIAVLREKMSEYGCKLLFVDNISRAAIISDEAAIELGRAVEALSDAAKEDQFAVLYDRHHKKGRAKLEDKGRGTNSAEGATENNVHIERMGEWESRVRRVSAAGRLTATRWQRFIELTEDGSDYREIEATTEYEADFHSRRRNSRQEVLADYGETGATAAQFADRLGLSDKQAREVLNDFVRTGEAIKTGEAKPFVYVAREPKPEPNL